MSKRNRSEIGKASRALLLGQISKSEYLEICAGMMRISGSYLEIISDYIQITDAGIWLIGRPLKMKERQP